MVWANNLCRLCGSLGDEVYPIFKGDQSLELKIKKCSNLTVFKDDYKPKQICGNCNLKVNDFCQFIDTISITNQKFDSIMSRSDWSQNLLGYPPQQKSVIVSSKPPMDNLDCGELDLYKDGVLPLESFNVPLNETDVLQIVESATDYSNVTESNTYLVDRYSGDAYNEYGTVLRHSSHFHLPNEVCSTDTAINYSFHPQKPECNVVKSNNDLSNKKCENYYKYSESFNNYNLDFQQPYNNKSKPNLISVETIQSSVNPESIDKSIGYKTKEKKSFPCPRCNKIFVRRITLNAHMSFHTNNKPYICELCDKMFAVKSNLTSHQKIHTSQYKCKICGKTFSVPSKLQRHERIHTKLKPFICDVGACKKAFTDKSNLEEHKGVHNQERNIKCGQCEKYFKTRNQLKSHKKSHDLDKSFVCDICQKSYKYKINLNLHMKKHNGYYCPYCKVNCERIVNLLKHRKECKLKIKS